MLLGYFTAPADKRNDVLRCITGYLEFSEDEARRTGLNTGHKGFFGIFGGATQSGGDNDPNDVSSPTIKLYFNQFLFILQYLITCRLFSSLSVVHQPTDRLFRKRVHSQCSSQAHHRPEFCPEKRKVPQDFFLLAATSGSPAAADDVFTLQTSDRKSFVQSSAAAGEHCFIERRGLHDDLGSLADRQQSGVNNLGARYAERASGSERRVSRVILGQ